MHTVQESLVLRLANDLQAEFLLGLEENLNALETSTFNHHQTQYPTPEINFMAQGQSEHFDAMQAIHATALKLGMQSSIVPTNPKGSFFVKLSTESFVFVCIRSESKNWASAKHKKQLGSLNRSLDDKVQDMFEPSAIEAINDPHKIFIIACVEHINLSKDNGPKDVQVFFTVPNSSLTANLLTVTVQELLEAHTKVINTDELEPVVALKGRLNKTGDQDETGTS